MNHAIFYDTETTGFPLFSEPSSDPRQPHIVQLAAVVVNLETREVVAEMNRIVKPEGWSIPDEVAKIHGITNEIALEKGIPEGNIIEEFLCLLDTLSSPAGHRVTSRIGHNEPFDARIVRIALSRFGVDDSTLAFWTAFPAQCTMALATPICKIPPTPKMLKAGRRGHKQANLGEAYYFFTGKTLDGAHDAMVDVKGCVEVYFACQDWKNGKGEY